MFKSERVTSGEDGEVFDIVIRKVNKRKMSAKNEYIDVKNEHLFDQGEFNVYDTKYTNLSVGAPGPDLLKYCTEYFPIATEHRLVRNQKAYQHFFKLLGCNDNENKDNNELSSSR